MRRALLTILAAVCVAACGRPANDAPTQAPTPASQTPAAFPFTDVTATSGVDLVHHNGATGERYFPESMGPGVALFDADGDGDLDLYAVQGADLPLGRGGASVTNRLFLNRGDGKFDDATAASGAADPGYGMGVAVGDFDGDGRPDLYVLNYGPNVLYRNLGDGRFAAATAGVEDPGWSVGAAFLDFDGDGDLDLYVVDYLRYDAGREAPCTAGPLRIYCSPEPFPPAPDHLYRNDGGRFTDVAAEAGVGYGGTGQIEGGMGATVADFTGDGRAAIFLTNFQKEPNRLYVAAGGGFFDDRTLSSGLGFPSFETVSWGMAALDVEGDGDLDLAVANGHVYDNAEQFIRGSAYRMPDQLFTNDGSGRFSVREFPGEPLSSRGMAAGDLDGDGDPDLVVASCGGRLRIWRNDAGRRDRFLILELRGRPPNTSAYGARVVAEMGGRTLHRAVTGGGGYESHSDARVVLGLGESARVDRIEVRWSDGTVETAADVAGGRDAVWVEGEGLR